MKLVKNTMIFLFISLITNLAFANKMTVHANPYQQYEINDWKFEAADDGMFFILGEYTKKLLFIHAKQTTQNGSPADPVTALCNASNEEVYREHRLEPGATLVCKGNFQDVVRLFTAPGDFKNGAQGTFEFQSIK